MIGSLGDVVFNVSSEAVLTFSGLTMQRGAAYAEHKVHGGKALLEFTGLSPANVNMKIHLDAALGTPPDEQLSALRSMLAEHEAVPFILDGTPQGDYLWVLESVDEEQQILNSEGTLISAEVTLTLKEYAG